MNDTIVEPFENKKLILHRVKFVILLVLQIPLIVISLLIFAFFIKHRVHLHSPQNQALLFLLIVNFLLVSVDLPMPIHFYYDGYVSPATASYCTWWTFFEYNLNLSSELLMAVISIQRHILVFHAYILQIRLKRFLLYYLPLLLAFIYSIIFYMIVIVFYPCDGTQWDFTSNLCGYANCYLEYDKVLGTFDWGVNNGLPIVIIILANIALVVRVIKQKRRRQQHPNSRKNQRRMTLQLLRISSLYLISWLPSLIIGVGQQLISPNFLAELQSDYALDLIYLVCLFLPWVSLRLLPECTKWIRKQMHCGRTPRNIVRPK
jgi:hypothetical protein